MSGGWTPTVHLFSQSRGKLRFDEELQAFVPGRPGRRQTCARPAPAAAIFDLGAPMLRRGYPRRSH